MRNFDIRIIVIIISIITFIASSDNPRLVCMSEGTVCQIHSKVLGIKKTKDFLAPEMISSYETKNTKRMNLSSRRSSREVGTDLVIITPYNRRYVLFKYRRMSEARSAGEQLMSCVKNKSYPCEVYKY